MGISPAITTASWGVDSKGWLLARKGFDTCRSITLDLALFTVAKGFTLGYIPSGTVLGKVTASGLYGPYNPAGADGREVAAGHLFDAVALTDGEGNAFTVAGAALFWEGIVRRDMLPAFTGTEGELDAAAETDMAKLIRYER
jgi:hypothetical protein